MNSEHTEPGGSSTCKFSLHNNASETPFLLPTPGFVLQTQVGEGQGVSLLIKPHKRLLGLFKQMANEMQVGFCSVNGHDDEPDLVIATNDDVVHFEIMDKLCHQHGLTCMPFEVKINDVNTICHILQSSSDFYWHLHHSSQGSPLAGKVNLECMKLEETGGYMDDLELLLMPDPNGKNLNIRDVIMVDVDKAVIYGFKITNMMSVPLYVSMFYFNVSDLSISMPSSWSLPHVLMTKDLCRFVLPTGTCKERYWCLSSSWRLVDHWVQHKWNSSTHVHIQAETGCWCWLLEAFLLDGVYGLVGCCLKNSFWWCPPEQVTSGEEEPAPMAYNVHCCCSDKGEGSMQWCW